MRNNLLIGFIFYSAILIAQDKYLDRKGTIFFEASETTFEPVKAKNNSVTAIVNVKTGEMAALALVKEFQFRNALMQEHFNENYIESDRYPKAIFKGKILKFNLLELTETKKEFKIIGTLNFHGVDKEIEAKLSISNRNGIINLQGNLIAKPQEFNIKIPRIVRNKIAKEVKVSFDFKLSKQ